MKTKQLCVGGVTLIVMLVLSVGLSQAQTRGTRQATMSEAPVGSAFTYQGYLTLGGNPASGAYDFQFILYDAPNGGNQMGSIVQKGSVDVANGLFSLALDFGSVFDGTRLWLEVATRPAGGTGYTILSPRQEITPSPYALYVSRVYRLSAPDGDPAAALAVDNGGSVGIGTTTPEAKLDVRGTIRSTADTRVIVHPFGLGSWSNLGVRTDESGYTYLQSSVTGSQQAHVGVTLPSQLFGIPQKLKSIKVCYQLDNASSYISTTEAYYYPDSGDVKYLFQDETDRKSISWTCYTYDDPTPDLIEGAAIVRFWLNYAGTGWPNEIVIGSITLTLTEN